MDRVLLQRQLHTTGPMAPNTLVVLPPDKKGLSRVAAGDTSGELVAFRATGKGVSVIFNSKLQLAGFRAVVRGGRRGVGDKVFAGVGSKVVGLTRKGKPFFELETNLTEPVDGLWVEDSVLLTASAHTLSRFTTDAGAASYDAPETLTAVLGITLPDGVHALAGYADATLVLFAPPPPDAATLVPVATLALPAPPTVAIHALPPHPNSFDARVLVGCADGTLCAIDVAPGALTAVWKQGPPGGPGPGKAVRSMASFDLLQTGSSRQLVVGTAEGSVDVYDLSAADDGDAPKRHPRILSTKLSESVATVACGVLDADNPQPTVVVATFSGMIFLLTPVSAGGASSAAGLAAVAAARGGDHAASVSDKEKQRMIDALERELVSLRFHARETELKYRKLSKGDLPLVRSAETRVEVSFELDRAVSAYVLRVEAVAPLATVILQADTPLEIGVLDQAAGTAPVVARTAPPPNSSSQVLVTLRPQHAERRLAATVRSVEGQAGTLRVYAIIESASSAAVLERLAIKPLSLHSRLPAAAAPSMPADSAAVLSISGALSLTQLFAWLALALPSMPDRIGDVADGGAVTYAFESVFLGTKLVVDMGPRPATWAKLTSDNPSTISILREVVTREASARSVSLKVQVAIGPGCVAALLAALAPRFADAVLLARKAQLLDGLTELAAAPDPALEPELAAVVAEADTIRTRWRKEKPDVDYLFGVLTDLYIDVAKFAGIDGRANVDALVDAVHADGWAAVEHAFAALAAAATDR